MARALRSLALLVAAVTTSAQTYDLAVYGATPGGIMTAISAAREGLNVALLHPLGHIGGIVASGLGMTDVGNSAAIGGMSLEFFNNVCAAQGSTKAPCFKFAPHEAEQTFLSMLSNATVASRINVFTSMTLVSAKTSGTQITSISVAPTTLAESVADLAALPTSSLTTVTASYFADGSYEGDLIAAAGASFAIGREARDLYNETLGGVQKEPSSHGGHQFHVRVDPLDHTTGQLLPMIYNGTPGTPGEGDTKEMAFNFRMCLTQNVSNMRPIPKPSSYDPTYWELFRRYLSAAGINGVTSLANFSPVGHGKTDVNNNGAISTDFIGGSWGWALATPQQRKAMWQEHYDYTAGFFWFLQNDPAVPAAVQAGARSWGLAADEFVDNGNWPWQLYVRSARRLVGEYVFVQQDREFNITKEDSIGLFSYNIDTHNSQRYINGSVSDPFTWVYNEGDIEVFGGPLGQIPYRALLPKRTEVTNLISPVPLSASHLGYGCLRLEPQFMIIGQSAGVAVAQALKSGKQAVQDVDVPTLQARLRELGQLIDLKKQ